MEASISPAARVAPTWPTLAVVNDPSSGVDDATASEMTHAVSLQVLEHFGPAWHIGAHVRFVGRDAKPPAGAWVVALLGTSDEAGALGYHDLTPDGLPLGKVFAATDRRYGQQVSVTLSHEVLEMLGDPWISLSAQGPDGKFYAWETCDAVEADELAYPIKGVQVSSFVTPAWFGTGAGAVCYPEGRVQRPLELAAGGYISVFDPASGQGWQQVTARGLVDASPAEVALALPRIGSRRERRFRGKLGWVASTFDQA